MPAKQILTDRRDQIERVARELLRREALDAAAFNGLPADNRTIPAS